MPERVINRLDDAAFWVRKPRKLGVAPLMTPERVIPESLCTHCVPEPRNWRFVEIVPVPRLFPTTSAVPLLASPRMKLESPEARLNPVVPKLIEPIVALAVSDGAETEGVRKLKVPRLDGKVGVLVPDQLEPRLKLVLEPSHVYVWADAGDMWAIAKPPHATAKAVRISRLNPFRRSFPAMIEPPRRKEPTLP